MVELVIGTTIGVFAGGLITWAVARHYAREATSEFRLITRAFAKALSRTGTVNIDFDERKRIVGIQIDDQGVSMSRPHPWWKRLAIRIRGLGGALIPWWH